MLGLEPWSKSTGSSSLALHVAANRTKDQDHAEDQRRVARNLCPMVHACTVAPMSSISGEIHSTFRRPTPQWQRPAGLDAVLAAWRSNPAIASHICLEHHKDSVSAHATALPDELSENVRAALVSRGISELFTHQQRAFKLATSGRDVVVATPTASGKSLCFNLPILHRLSQEPEARALYLFPTKALSRDQEQSLRALTSEAKLSSGAITYDGDTPADARRSAREHAGLVLSNPDMLHAGILPHHAAWARFFSNLRYVVIDEAHTYRGVFGSHLANVIRRLVRIARFHGSEPIFMFASATIGNPQEHTSRLVGRHVEAIAESGAPNGARETLVYNPPVLNAELGIRQSYVKARGPFYTRPDRSRCAHHLVRTIPQPSRDHAQIPP